MPNRAARGRSSARLAARQLLGVPQRPARHLLAPLLWLRPWARGPRIASRVAFPGRGPRVPRSGGSPSWRLSFLDAGLASVRFFCSNIFFFLFFPPNKPTLRKRRVAAKALSWPLASWRFSTFRAGRFYQQPRCRQNCFHPKLWISVKSSPEMWSLASTILNIPSVAGIFLVSLPLTIPGGPEVRREK